MSIALAATLAMTLPGGGPRRWEDEVVYGIIIEKFCDGDPSNNYMRDRYFRTAHATRAVSGGAI